MKSAKQILLGGMLAATVMAVTLPASAQTVTGTNRGADTRKPVGQRLTD
jgi:hypothetical protein